MRAATSCAANAPGRFSASATRRACRSCAPAWRIARSISGWCATNALRPPVRRGGNDQRTSPRAPRDPLRAEGGELLPPSVRRAEQSERARSATEGDGCRSTASTPRAARDPLSTEGGELLPPSVRRGIEGDGFLPFLRIRVASPAPRARAARAFASAPPFLRKGVEAV